MGNGGLYEVHFGPPKTPNRIHCLPLPPKCVADLMMQQSRGHHTGPHDLVFCSRTGGPLLLTIIERDVLRPKIENLVRCDKLAAPISPYIYGQFIEHIGDLVNRSVWAEMLDDRKFYFDISSKVTPQAPPFRGRIPNRWMPI